MCPSGHIAQKWTSQPIVRGRPLGDIMLATSILVSGNNFKKIQLLAQSMQMSMISAPTFFRFQRLYCFPAISEYWEKLITSNRRKVLGKPVILLGM